MSQHSRYLSNLRRLGQVWAIISWPCGLSIARHYSEDIIGQLMSWLVIRTSGSCTIDLIKNQQITNSSKYSTCRNVHFLDGMVTSLLSRDGRNMWDQITDEGRKHLSKARWLSCHRWSNPGLMVWWGPESFYFSLDNRHNIRLFTQRNFVLENLGKTKTLLCNSVFIRLVPLWFSFDFGKVCFHASHLCLGWLDALHDSLLVYWSHLDLGGSCAEPVISYTFAWKTDVVFILNCIALVIVTVFLFTLFLLVGALSLTRWDHLTWRFRILDKIGGHPESGGVLTLRWKFCHN